MDSMELDKSFFLSACNHTDMLTTKKYAANINMNNTDEHHIIS